MPKNKTQSAITAVTAERAARLFRLLNLFRAGPQSRASLTRRLHLEVRGFYRDLGVLRAVGLVVELNRSKYRLVGDVDEAIEKLPFPDPGMNLGEARLLARGRTRAHKKIRELLQQIEK